MEGGKRSKPEEKSPESEATYRTEYNIKTDNDLAQIPFKDRLTTLKLNFQSGYVGDFSNQIKEFTSLKKLAINQDSKSKNDYLDLDLSESTIEDFEIQECRFKNFYMSDTLKRLVISDSSFKYLGRRSVTLPLQVFKNIHNLEYLSLIAVVLNFELHSDFITECSKLKEITIHGTDSDSTSNRPRALRISYCPVLKSLKFTQSKLFNELKLVQR